MSERKRKPTNIHTYTYTHKYTYTHTHTHTHTHTYIYMHTFTHIKLSYLDEAQRVDVEHIGEGDVGLALLHVAVQCTQGCAECGRVGLLAGPHLSAKHVGEDLGL